MTPRNLLLPVAVVSAWLAILPSASAHRVDEYLQATRLSIDNARVDLELDLTPGIALANEVFASIDTNGDGAISDAEGAAYASQVLRSLVLSTEGKPVALTLTESHYPPFRDMTLGLGTIRLRATARMPAGSSGHHQLTFLNKHRPERSVYLVNALVPENPRVRVTNQQRDPAQYGVTVAYTIAAEPPPAWAFALFGTLVLGARWLLRWQRVAASQRAAATHINWQESSAPRGPGL
jgi:hypothetical protein